MTVIECCNKYKYNKKGFWLCPNICNNMGITPKPLERGIDYQNIGSIPKELLNKEVTKTFREDGIICIIWKNE